jgi:hypothetical protein
MDPNTTVAAMLPEDATANRSTERARESRRRKKDGLRLIPIEIFEQEIAELVQLGLLPAHEHNDKLSVSHALYPVIEAGLAAVKKG